MRAASTTFVGFNSAWTDNPKAPGAIATLALSGETAEFKLPRLVTFAQALEVIADVDRASDCTLVALDQPTIVVNTTSMRPVERVAASTISWLGGGVQPSNRGRLGMFCDASPIWQFLAALNASEDPPLARTAIDGIHLIEVFPALALPSLDAGFFGRGLAPRYNPSRRTFRHADWARVANVVAMHFADLGFDEAGAWCRGAGAILEPRKADQDCLDAMICLLVALFWRLKPPSETMMLGSLADGYMVLPVSAAVRDRLSERARLMSLPFEQLLP